jgi:biopolymer transport protein ExbD
MQSDINLDFAPLCDLAFILLSYLLLLSNFRDVKNQLNNQTIDLPYTKSVQTCYLSKDENIRFDIWENGAIYCTFDINKPSTILKINNLNDELKTYLELHPKPKILFHCDKNAPYASFQSITEILQQHHINKYSISA